ncbi:MAG TPA: hypothetical protein VLH40_03980 [Atribacteraceae bacterium]|nr:hypothetical protein [Atribacteraceae bacterium]
MASHSGSVFGRSFRGDGLRADPGSDPDPDPPPPPVDKCPTTWTTAVASTVVEAVYGDVACPLGGIEIIITFDKEIILMDDIETNWLVQVDRLISFYSGGVAYTEEVFDIPATVTAVEQFGSSSIRIRATVEQQPWLEAGFGPDPGWWFCGLICDEASYALYLRLANLNAGWDPADPLPNPPIYTAHADIWADQVFWEYAGTGFPVADADGELCAGLCDIKGDACCVVCPECPEPIDWCPIGEVC